MTNSIMFTNSFRKLSPDDRLEILQNIQMVKNSSSSVDEQRSPKDLDNAAATVLADTMVESALGNISVPIGLAVNLPVDTQFFHVPLATEESSVVVAVNYAAKIFSYTERNRRDRTTTPFPHTIRATPQNSILTRINPPLQIAQIPIPNVPKQDEYKIQRLLPYLHNALMVFLQSMHRRGGGIRRVEYKRLKSGLIVIHLTIDVQEAMGANIANTAAEFAAKKITEICGYVPLAAIISNFSEERLVHAKITLNINALPKSKNKNSLQVAQDIVHMSTWAEEDIYRAVTNNKGIMNGVVGLALATYNDVRALEAASHSLAASFSTLLSSPFCNEVPFNQHVDVRPNTNYHPLSIWRINEQKNQLCGTITLPALLASIGGSTQHPLAVWTRSILAINQRKKIQTHHLNRIAAGIGLAQNFAALLALTTQGIQKGHMRLHQRKL